MFSIKLFQTDFLGGWKKSRGEYATDVSSTSTTEIDS